MLQINLYFLHRQVIGDYQRLAYIINDYQGVHFERLFFMPSYHIIMVSNGFSFIFCVDFVPHGLIWVFCNLQGGIRMRRLDTQ